MSDQPSNIRSYYRLHAKIYDATRWTFLFGRNAILKLLSVPAGSSPTLVEVGCGTGRNLKRLAKMFPELQLIGIDVSADMLSRARKATADYGDRVQLFEFPYAPGKQALPQAADIILFSYALTMFNPGWEDAVLRAKEDLKPGGIIAVVDFHDSPWSFFRWWMGKNHVRMEAHLTPFLEQHFKPMHFTIKKAWFGVWRYCLFVGVK